MVHVTYIGSMETTIQQYFRESERVLLNNAATLDAAKSMNACEDFLDIVLTSNVVGAAEYLHCSNDSSNRFDKVEDMEKEIVI